jgi:hypothetical protein
MKNKFSVVFKILIVIISFIGILLNIGLYGNFQMLLYFTNLSKIPIKDIITNKILNTTENLFFIFHFL